MSRTQDEVVTATELSEEQLDLVSGGNGLLTVEAADPPAEEVAFHYNKIACVYRFEV